MIFTAVAAALTASMVPVMPIANEPAPYEI